MKSVAYIISSLESELPVSEKKYVACKSRDEDPPSDGELVVDWPGVDNQIEFNKRMVEHKKVRFSESSKLRIYAEDYTYMKSYSKVERKVFGKKLLYTAHKIRSALESTDADSSVSVARRLEFCGISKEELVGLEGLVLEKSPSDVAKLRKLLVKAVMLEQEKQKILCQVDDDRIGDVSRSFSMRSGDKARERATATD